MRRAWAFGLLLFAVGASAHPIEPLVTGSPMPVPQDSIAADSVYSAVNSGATEQTIGLSLAGGIGGMAEISVATAIDATEGNVGPIVAGGKFLFAMEGRRGIDLALQAAFASDGVIDGTLLAGRTLIPGLYLQGAAGVVGASGPALAARATSLTLHRAPQPRHGVDLPSGSNLIVVHGAAALQWAPRPRWIPTFEVAGSRTFDDLGTHHDVVVVPELIYLVEINHLSVKAGVPIGVSGTTSYGVLASLDWQR
jgi:hypothetical protein